MSELGAASEAYGATTRFCARGSAQDAWGPRL